MHFDSILSMLRFFKKKKQFLPMSVNFHTQTTHNGSSGCVCKDYSLLRWSSLKHNFTWSICCCRLLLTSVWTWILKQIDASLCVHCTQYKGRGGYLSHKTLITLKCPVEKKKSFPTTCRKPYWIRPISLLHYYNVKSD